MIDGYTMASHLGVATFETLWVVVASGFLAGILGMLLGIALYAFNTPVLCAQPVLYRLLATSLNTMRAIPFIIFMIAILPLTRWLTGTAIGTTASIVPLTLAAMPMMARMTEHALLDLPNHLLETALAMGATRLQIFGYFLLPEAKANLIRQYTTACVTLTGYASMCGAMGGGGLGDYAIQYGYQRFEPLCMFAAIVIIWGLVQGIEGLGALWLKQLQQPESRHV